MCENVNGNVNFDAQDSGSSVDLSRVDEVAGDVTRVARGAIPPSETQEEMGNITLRLNFGALASNGSRNETTESTAQVARGARGAIPPSETQREMGNIALRLNFGALAPNGSRDGAAESIAQVAGNVLRPSGSQGSSDEDEGSEASFHSAQTSLSSASRREEDIAPAALGVDDPRPAEEGARGPVQVAYTTRSSGLDVSRKIGLDEQGMQRVAALFSRMKGLLHLDHPDIAVSYNLASRTITIGGSPYDIRVKTNMRQLFAVHSQQHAQHVLDDGDLERTMAEFKNLHVSLEELLRPSLVLAETGSGEASSLLMDPEFVNVLRVSHIPVELLRNAGLVEGASDKLTEEGCDMCKKMALMRLLRRCLLKEYTGAFQRGNAEISRLQGALSRVLRDGGSLDEQARLQRELNIKKEEVTRYERALKQLASPAFQIKAEFLLVVAYAKRGGDAQSFARSAIDAQGNVNMEQLKQALAMAADWGKVLLSKRTQREGIYKWFRVTAKASTTQEQGAIGLLASGFFDMLDPQGSLYAIEKVRGDAVKDSSGGVGAPSCGWPDPVMGCALFELLAPPTEEGERRHFDDRIQQSPFVGEFRRVRLGVERIVQGAMPSAGQSYKNIEELLDKKSLNKAIEELTGGNDAPGAEAGG